MPGGGHHIVTHGQLGGVGAPKIFLLHIRGQGPTKPHLRSTCFFVLPPPPPRGWAYPGLGAHIPHVQYIWGIHVYFFIEISYVNMYLFL